MELRYRFLPPKSDRLEPRKLPRMNKTEIDELLKEQILCRIDFGGKNAPYIAPL